MINILLNTILKNNTNISKILLQEVKIISGNSLKDEEISYIMNKYKDNNENDEKSSINKNSYDNGGINFEKNKTNKNNNAFMIENKENIDINNNKQYFETDCFKKSKIANTMISINQFIINSRYSISEPIKNLINVDNNDDCQYDKDNNESEFIIHKKSDESIKSKKSSFSPKNKYTFLSNKYFNNLEKELSITYNCYYNENLFDLLLSLLEMHSDLEPKIIELTIENISLLVTKKCYNNKIQSILSQEHFDKIKNIYEKYKNEILYYYNNKKSFHNNAYKLFMKQYDILLLLNDINFSKIISNDNFFLKNESFKNKDIKNKYDKIIISFLLIHDFYYTMILSDYYYKNNIKLELDIMKLYKESFELLNGDNYLKVNKQYSIINLDSNIRYYDCKCKIVQNKKEMNENFFDSYILFLDNFIYIGDSQDDSRFTTIKYKFLISSCSILIDNYNNKNIIIYIENNIYDNNNFEIFLDFKDYTASNYFI